jgi:hypothetical protein
LTPLALFLLGPAIYGHMLDIQSETECPSASAIEAHVRQILDLEGKRVEERAIVTHDGHALRVVLRGADGRDVGERLLSTDASCDDLAQAVAVVLATWISDVHPEFVGALPQRQPEPDAKPIDTRSATTSEPRARFAHEVATPETTPPRGVSRHIEPGLGVGVGIAGPKAAAVASLVAAWIPSSGIGLAVSATLASTREQPLADGTLAWRRWPVAAGLVLRVPLRGALLDFSGGGAFAWSHLVGRGFPSTSSADDFALGAFASARVASSEGTLVPFAALTGYAWLARSAAYVRPEGGAELDLPRYDFTLVAGVAWRP